jgi:hypothetical protein
MIKASFDDKEFLKQMNNLVDYSLGYVDGVKRGKTKLLENLGDSVINSLKQFIDSNARVSPEALHHVYEWGMTGSPEARLYDIHYTISNLGLSFRSTFRQSSSVQEGSLEPFYNKAKIMEDGIPVRIEPRQSSVLAFNDDGKEVFTPNPVTVSNPGGAETTGSFEKIFDSFFANYFSQAFLRSSGILDYINNPVLYKNNLRAGLRSGRSTGFETGYRWIANAGMVNK